MSTPPYSRSPFDDDPEDEGIQPDYGRRDDTPVIRRIRHNPIPDYDEEEVEPTPRPVRVAPRPGVTDPTFGLLISFALNIGLAALGPSYGDLRMVITSALLAIFGVGAWLLGDTARIRKETPENLVWGIVFGIIVGAPLLIVGGSTLHTTVELVFRTGSDDSLIQLPVGMVLALVVFVLPLGETLFFRGLVQTDRAWWLAGALASAWAILLFMPMIEMQRYPLVAFMIATALILVNMMYSYVCRRNGLASAWLCQITVNLLILFIPYLSG
ncbi:MAG: hypothetical protein IAE89_07230 [Anaerolineae bacterium]|nr:hypothetical protein [Anaerolineae bacterium]